MDVVETDEFVEQVELQRVTDKRDSLWLLTVRVRVGGNSVGISASMENVVLKTRQPCSANT